MERECKHALRDRRNARKEVGRKGGDPVEDRVTGAGLEHEERDRLLEEEANNDGGPA